MLHSNFGRLAPFVFTVMATVALAQESGESIARTDGARPVIGLVLSGGGARGGAHVGVLQALEELGVPIDVIAGTSIGAIIGGFYASGLSVDEIATLTETIDWDAAFLEDAPRELISFRRKREDDLFLVDEKPGLSDRQLKLPLGAVQGQVIDMILTEQTLPVSHIDDFDELPVPFRAVATDLATGETVVMDSGNLANSIRASMSVPAVLSPIDIDGRLLVDGGVTMNLPVEIAQQMGADIVIAVDISSPMLAREELTSVLDVTNQLTNILMRRGIDEQLQKLGPDDLLITPEFGDEFSSTGFSQMAAAIDVGYDATISVAPALSALAIAPADYATHLASIAGPKRDAAPTVDFIRLRNGAAISDAVIERHLRGIEIGEPLDLMAVEEAVNKIYGLELYQNVRYVLVEEGDQTGLEFRLDEQAWGPNYVQFGLGYSTAGKQDALFGVAASYVGTQLNENNGEWRATVVLGDQPGVFTDLHQPFGRNNAFFVAPSFSLRSELYNVFDNGMRVTELQLDRATVEVALGQELGTWGEIRAGVRRISGRVVVEVGEPDRIPEGDFDDGQFFTRFSVDTLDRLTFPTSGSIMRLEWRGASQGQIGANVDYDQVSLEGAYAKTWDRYTLLARLRYDTTVSGAAPINSFYRLGGFLDLSGLNQNELIGQNVARVGAVLYRRINNLAFLPAFAGVSLELGNVWQQRSDIGSGDSLLGGSVWIGVDTPIGPVYAAYGRAEDDRDAFYLFLGRIF